MSNVSTAFACVFSHKSSESFECIHSGRLLYQPRTEQTQGMGTVHPVLHGLKRQHGVPGALPVWQGKPRGLRQATGSMPKSQDGRRRHSIRAVPQQQANGLHR